MGGGGGTGGLAFEIPPALRSVGMTSRGLMVRGVLVGGGWRFLRRGRPRRRNDVEGGDRPSPTSPRRPPQAVEGSKVLAGAMVRDTPRPRIGGWGKGWRGQSLWAPGI